MSVSGHCKLLHGRLGSNGIGTLLDQVGGMNSNDVNTQQLARILVVEDLADAIRFVLGEGLRIRLEMRSLLAKLDCKNKALIKE